MPTPVSLLWVVSFICMFLLFFKTRRKKNVCVYVSVCMPYVGIICRPRLIIFFFLFFLLSVYLFYNILKIVMLKNVSQSKDAKKWSTDSNFQTPASTGRKVEMASANAVYYHWLWNYHSLNL